MNKNNRSSLIGAFAKAYHFLNSAEKIFRDSLAKNLFSDEEYESLSVSLSKSAALFNPSLLGGSEEALKWFMNTVISPLPLARGIFAQKALERAVSIGAKQYIIFNSGYDTFAHRQPSWAKGINIFELDRPALIYDKQTRLRKAGLSIPPNLFYSPYSLTQPFHMLLNTHKKYNFKRRCLASFLGSTYYISKSDFKAFLLSVNSIIPHGSSIIFDYPHRELSENSKSIFQHGKHKRMPAYYSYFEIESLLSDCGFLIYEHMTDKDMAGLYFSTYNRLCCKNNIVPPPDVFYCLAVKK